MGIDAPTLAAIPLKIVVAGERYKVQPIIGACRGGFVDFLVTDEGAASGIVERLNAEAAGGKEVPAPALPAGEAAPSSGS